MLKKKKGQIPQTTSYSNRNQYIENTACAIILPFPITYDFKKFLWKLENQDNINMQTHSSPKRLWQEATT